MVGEVVRADDLRVVFGGREVLRGLTFRLPAGSVVGLIGPRRSGKTTLIRSLLGERIITGGTVHVLGHPVGSPALHGRIGYRAQRPHLYLDLTIRQNLRYFACVLCAPPDEPDHLLAEIGLEEARDRLCAELSGSQLSQVGNAVSLLGTPELLLLDEPTADLNPELHDQLWQLLHRRSTTGATAIVSTRASADAAQCDRLLMLRDGKLLAYDIGHGTAPDLERTLSALLSGPDRAAS